MEVGEFNEPVHRDPSRRLEVWYLPLVLVWLASAVVVLIGAVRQTYRSEVSYRFFVVAAAVCLVSALVELGATIGARGRN